MNAVCETVVTWINYKIYDDMSQKKFRSLLLMIIDQIII